MLASSSPLPLASVTQGNQDVIHLSLCTWEIQTELCKHLHFSRKPKELECSLIVFYNLNLASSSNPLVLGM